HAYVAIVTDPADYPGLLAELEEADGGTRLPFRKALAAKAFAATAAYDAAIGQWFATADQSERFAPRRSVASRLVTTLRYGENPHQSAALYVPEDAPVPGIAQAEQVQGKALSYNNYNDASAALELAA